MLRSPRQLLRTALCEIAVTPGSVHVPWISLALETGLVLSETMRFRITQRPMPSKIASPSLLRASFFATVALTNTGAPVITLDAPPSHARLLWNKQFTNTNAFGARVNTDRPGNRRGCQITGSS